MKATLAIAVLSLAGCAGVIPTQADVRARGPEFSFTTSKALAPTRDCVLNGLASAKGAGVPFAAPTASPLGNGFRIGYADAGMFVEVMPDPAGTKVDFYNRLHLMEPVRKAVKACA